MIIKSKEVSLRLSHTATEFSLQKPAFLFCAVEFCVHPPISPKTLDRDTMQQQLLCTWLIGGGRCRSPFFTTSPLLQHRNTAPHIEKASKQAIVWETILTIIYWPLKKLTPKAKPTAIKLLAKKAMHCIQLNGGFGQITKTTSAVSNSLSLSCTQHGNTMQVLESQVE